MEKPTPDFTIDVTGFWLPSTKGAKYAHALNWTPWGQIMEPLCGVRFKSWNSTSDRNYASGKPPCPKCVSRLKHHQRWLAAIVESYENLQWEDAE